MLRNEVFEIAKEKVRKGGHLINWDSDSKISIGKANITLNNWIDYLEFHTDGHSFGLNLNKEYFKKVVNSSELMEFFKSKYDCSLSPKEQDRFYFFCSLGDKEIINNWFYNFLASEENYYFTTTRYYRRENDNRNLDLEPIRYYEKNIKGICETHHDSEYILRDYYLLDFKITV